MADPSPHPGTGNDTGVGPDRESTTGAPRWAKVFGIIVAVVVVLFVIVLLLGGGPLGGHGPGRHTSSQDTGGQAPVPVVTADHAPLGALEAKAPLQGRLR